MSKLVKAIDGKGHSIVTVMVHDAASEEEIISTIKTELNQNESRRPFLKQWEKAGSRWQLSDPVDLDAERKDLPKKIKLEDVIAYNKAGSEKMSIASLIKNCNDFERNLVSRDEFIAAREAIECKTCGRIVPSENYLKKGICSECEKIERARLAKVIILNKWEKLHDDLQAIDKNYEFVEADKFNDPKIKLTVKLINDDIMILSIYRDTVYNRGSWHATGHALRIGSSDYEYENRKLRKDFGAKNLAESLHNKIQELIKQKNNRLEIQMEKTKEKTNLANKIKAELQVTDDDLSNVYSAYGYGRNHRHTEYTGVKEVKFDKYRLQASINKDGNLEYIFKALGRSFNAEELKKVISFIEDL